MTRRWTHEDSIKQLGGYSDPTRSLSPVVIAGIILAALLAFSLAAVQSYTNARHGTDHAVHTFLIRAIRTNKFRLFVRIPRLLNEAYCAALPLYLHWTFAHFRPAVISWAERLLNPAVNGLHVILVAYVAALVADHIGAGDGFVVFTALIFALTPQFYHALSARNFGLSTRGIGLFLLSAFLLTAYGIESGASGPGLWALLAVVGYLVWAFSTFGAQSLVILSILLVPLGRVYVPLAGTVLGLTLFIAVHPRYSIGYLSHTFRFIRGYATELAPLYVLNRRYSIWRDLVWDIWQAIRRSPRLGFRYAYENPVVVLAVLNPLVLVIVGAFVFGWPPSQGIVAFSANVVLSGAAAMLLTSFRPTRFLGEPERYIEAVTPWAAVAGAALLTSKVGPLSLPLLACVYLALTASQLWASKMLSRYLSSKPINLEAAEAAIAAAEKKPVRCSSNNEQITKLLMHKDWEFAYCIAVGSGYCGMPLGEAFSSFPFLRREACERIVRTYRINICALDRNLYETLFDTPPPDLLGSRVIFESDGLRVLALDWSGSSAEPPHRDAAR